MKERSHSSATCDASFLEKENLNGHMTSVHDGKKRFKCDTYDDNSFLNKAVLSSCVAPIHGE